MTASLQRHGIVATPHDCEAAPHASWRRASKAFWCRLQDRKLCAEAGIRRLSVLLEAGSSGRKIRIELVVVWPANESDGRGVPGGGQGWLVAWVVGGGGVPVRRCACSMS